MLAKPSCLDLLVGGSTRLAQASAFFKPGQTGVERHRVKSAASERMSVK